MQKHPPSNNQKCANCLILEQEIVALKEDLAEMKQHAYHDVLTGLSNRRFFVESLENRVERCRRYGDNSALVFLDVDKLKAVNDTHGHAAGDALLIRLAKILKNHTRATDVVARIGGDEFGLLLDHLDGDEVVAKIDVLNAKLGSANLVHAGITLPLSASFGYCFIGPQDTTDGLMSRADAAMYDAKDEFR
ncbi:MAG: GGDEF domain-containing protein [Sphingopyxis sp.]|nr:MAG: GGDEF domain-containing protein [Sphingopyxis sp.]